MCHLKLRVTGMCSRRCVRQVTARLRDVPGVRTVTADARTSTVVIGGTMTIVDVLSVFLDSAYAPEVVDGASTPDPG
jgi:copper chaperone CopZ